MVPFITPIQIHVYFFLKTGILLSVRLSLSPRVIKQTGENFKISFEKIAQANSINFNTLGSVLIFTLLKFVI